MQTEAEMVCVFLVSDLSFGEKPQNKHRNKGQLFPLFFMLTHKKVHGKMDQ